MSAKTISLLLYFWMISVPAIRGVADIDTDYLFLDGALRMPKESDCDSPDDIQRCEVLCDGNHACVLGKCYCLEPSNKGIAALVVQKLTATADEAKPLLRSKPALRHHIAHFCPNLDVARTCIRECLKFGKPAFCGKDHVCYCGHKYESSDDEQEVNVGDVHEQFRDLYLKYFGPEQYIRK